MKRGHDKSYDRKNLSTRSRFLNDKQKLRDELVEDNNNNLKGQAPYECEIRPMSANGQSPYATHAGTQNFRGYIDQLHGHFMPIDEGTPEQRAIANGMCPIFNTNSPTLGEPVGSNGARINLEANNREGPATSGNTRNFRGVTYSSTPSEGMIGIAGGGFGTAGGNFNWGASSPNGTPSTEGFFYPGKMAKYFTPKDRKPADVKHIVLHSTDGRAGPGSAQRTIDRFAKGPTLSYRWTNKNTGKVIKNPPCADVIAVDGEIPHGTICHPERKKVEKPVKTSIHYAVDGGGAIIQGLQEKDIGYHTGGGYNSKSIGIEMCGKPSKGPGKGSRGLYAEMYNDTMIDATAKLCAEICKRWELSPDASVIIGHEKIDPRRRTDPGATLNPGKGDVPAGNYWDWDDFLARVRGYYSGGIT